MKLCFYFVFALCLLAHVFIVVSANPLMLPTLKATKLHKTKPRKIPKVISPADILSTTYYIKSCPNLEGIIQQKVNDWIKKDYTIAASIIRLHFHDCAVRVLSLILFFLFSSTLIMFTCWRNVYVTLRFQVR